MVVQLIVAVAIVSAATSAFARPDAAALLQAEAKADATCRGNVDRESGETLEACSRRDRLVGRLYQIGYCYGKKGQFGYQMKWHRCGPNSVMLDDLSATQ